MVHASVQGRDGAAAEERDLVLHFGCGPGAAFTVRGRDMRRRRAPSGHDMTCQQAVELVTDYLDDALPGDQAALFRAHLAECPHCTEHLAQIRLTVAATGQVRADDLDPLARADLIDLYRRWRAGI